jgi:hypothetical protein
LTRRKEQKSHPRAGHGGTLLGRSLSIYLALIASTSRRSHFPLFRTLFLRTLPRDDAVPVVVCAQMGTRNDRQANREKYFQSQKLTNAEDGDTHLHFFFSGLGRQCLVEFWATLYLLRFVVGQLAVSLAHLLCHCSCTHTCFAYLALDLLSFLSFSLSSWIYIPFP